MPTPELNKALAAVQAAIPHVAKGETANTGSYSYEYADLTAVSAAILPVLGKHGLAFTAWPTLDDGRFVLAYALTHASGEERTGTYPLPEKGTPQQLGGHITYARRYALCAVTGVAPGGDDNDAAGAPEMHTDRPRYKIPGADHERLRHPDPEERVNGRKAERVRAGQDSGPDPWQDQAAGTFDETPAEDRHGSIDGRQRSIIMAHLGKLRRDERLGKLAGLAGRLVESTNDLSFAEADKVIKAIEAEAAKASKEETAS